MATLTSAATRVPFVGDHFLTYHSHRFSEHHFQSLLLIFESSIDTLPTCSATFTMVSTFSEGIVQGSFFSRFKQVRIIVHRNPGFDICLPRNIKLKRMNFKLPRVHFTKATILYLVMATALHSSSTLHFPKHPIGSL